MTKSIDLSEFAPDTFLEQLDRLRNLNETLGVVLGVERQVLQEDRQRSKVTDPEAYQEWEHLVFDEQAYDLEECEGLRARFVLVQLELAAHRLVGQSEYELEAHRGNRPAPSGCSERRSKKPRTDWLQQARNRFVSQFGIDLSSGPEWNVLEEVVMARNAIIHPESLGDYKKSRPEARYLNGNELRLSPQELMATVEKLREFRTWLQKQLQARRG